MRLSFHVRISVAVWLITILTGPGLRGATIEVCGDGSAAYTTIQAGIDAAVDGDEVAVCPGTYSGPGNVELDFGGRAITVRGVAGPEATVIDCGYAGRGFCFQSGEDAASVVEGLTVTNGMAGAVLRSGGAILCVGASPTVRNCWLVANDGDEAGGGLYAEQDANPTLVRCAVTGNSAVIGGGVCVFNGHMAVVNSTITGNYALFPGGGVYAFEAAVDCTNTTFSGNTVSLSTDGSTAYCVAGALTFTQAIVWGNEGLLGAAMAISAIESDVTVGYCDVEGGQTAIRVQDGMLNWLAGNVDADPMFATSGSWQGLQAFIPYSGIWEPGDYRLSTGSPCIDAGDNDAVPAGVTTDLAGNPRFMDDPDTDDTGNGVSPIVDMGAYEFEGLTGQPPAGLVLDIRPGTCPNPLNLKSRGVLPVALLGTPDVDVASVDVDSIELMREGAEGAVAVSKVSLEDVAAPGGVEPCECVETGPDGLTDLVLKFRTADLVEALELRAVTADEPLVLTVRGQLADGTEFAASDCVRIVPRR